MKKIKVASVSYLNSKPFIYGLKNHPVREKIDLLELPPAKIAEQLEDGTIDIGLVSIPVLKTIHTAQIISPTCISCDGNVSSVALFSDVPFEKIDKIFLDYQSRTSVVLCRILAKELWKINPEFIPAFPGYEEKISKTTAGVIIGDRALMKGKNYAFKYDLGEAWKKLNGLPFVFACWISSKLLDPDFVKEFNKALHLGIQSIDKVAEQEQKNYPGIDISFYLKKNIQFLLNDEKRKAMSLFLEKSDQF
jgi:chorismate dehydratase